MSAPDSQHGETAGFALTLAALGVVFGDIGTSPLYALRECLTPPHGVEPIAANVLSVLSLIFWSLTMVVTVKYLAFVLRADNQGEGGILALLALVPERPGRDGRSALGGIAILALAGAALLYGDGIITPAISVLSAVEGLAFVASGLERLVVPLTVAILLALFAIQHRGTGGVGRLFGPVMALWFAVIAGLGLVHVARHPAVLAAVWPGHALRLFQTHPAHALRLLGSVVLVVTGGEALYADLGHFGRAPIRRAWVMLVFPSLLLAYFGQGALAIARPELATNLFFAMVPAGVATWLLIALATAATVIASQALISGVFSLTAQAMNLGYFPRVRVAHTSAETRGQIYIPAVNWALALACIALVLAFGHSSRLAAAYGIAVSGTMAVTSVLFYVVARRVWGWSAGVAVPLVVLFLMFDLGFFGANLLKLAHGGWVPIVIGAGFLLVMLNWKHGRAVLAQDRARLLRPWSDVVASLQGGLVVRTPGCGVFLTTSSAGAPSYFTHHLERTRAAPEMVVALTIEVAQVPVVAASCRYVVDDLGAGVHRLVARFGFIEEPDVPELVARAVAERKLPAMDRERVTYYVGRETLLAGPGGRMGRLSEGLFSFLSRNAANAVAGFGIPPGRVVEVGSQIDL